MLASIHCCSNSWRQGQSPNLVRVGFCTSEENSCSSPGLAHCTSCDLTNNLWLCLTCGNLGCGRKQAGGLEGHGHALAHYQDSHHSISVKLGTITPEGGAGALSIAVACIRFIDHPDIYCYACDDARQDPEIAAHLKTFGINIQSLAKTEKSMTELVRYCS